MLDKWKQKDLAKEEWSTSIIPVSSDFPDVSNLNPNPSAETRRHSEKGTSNSKLSDLEDSRPCLGVGTAES